MNMFNFGIFNAFSRTTIRNVLQPARSFFINAPLYFNTTNALLGEPLKKKKKIDPAILRQREERAQRRLGKVIKRLEKRAQILKPVFEIGYCRPLAAESQIRKRSLPTLSPEKLEERALLLKKWNQYKTEQHKQTKKLIEKFMSAQENALKELKAESNELYLSAIQIDEDLLPFSAKGPVRTPPIENFEPPHGDYIDITRKYD